jgi:hypothetical protein
LRKILPGMTSLELKWEHGFGTGTALRLSERAEISDLSVSKRTDRFIEHNPPVVGDFLELGCSFGAQFPGLGEENSMDV